MITENIFVEDFESNSFGNFDVNDELLIDSWSKVSIAIKEFTNNITTIVNEYINNVQVNASKEFSDEKRLFIEDFNEKFGDKLTSRINSLFENVEIKESIRYIHKRGLSIEILECFLSNALENTISREMIFFCQNFEIVCEDNFNDSRLMSNETNSLDELYKQNDREVFRILNLSDGNVISFHYCLFFGLVRLVWSYILVIYGISYILDIKQEERYCFVINYITCKNGYLTNKLNDISIERIIFDFRDKIYLYFSEGLPQGFDIIMDKYISNLIINISNEITCKEDINLNNDIIQISLRERVLKEFLNKCSGNFSQRMENYLSKVENFQHLYEHMSSKILSLNGSFPSNLDYETLEDLFKLIEHGTKCSEKPRKEDLNINFELIKITEVLSSISDGPIPNHLNLSRANMNYQDLLSLHMNVYNDLIKFLFGSNNDKVADCLDKISIFNFIGDLIVLIKIMGYEEIWRTKIIFTLRLQAMNIISFLEKRKNDESNLRIYSKYIHEFVGPLLMILLDGGIEFISNIETYIIQKIYENLYMEFSWSLKRRIIYLIENFPENKNDILDLFVLMNSFPSSDILKDVWYSEISREISNYVNDVLLLPQIETSKIIGFYIKSVYFLLLLDIPNDWINKTLEKLGDVLRQRNDTTQCMITWMPFLLENSSIINNESELIMPISCSDEGVYPQFSICYPNYKNECNPFTILDEEDKWRSFENNFIRSMRNPQIKLVLSWISRIYGNNLTLLHDYIFNLASKVLGNCHDIGYDGRIAERGSRNGLVDDYSWNIDEKSFRRDESVYEMIKMTIGGHNGEDLFRNKSGNAKTNDKDEQQLITHCNIILQDINSSILDNREYNNYRRVASSDDRTIVTGFTLSRNYWSENIINIEIKEESFPISSILEEKINEYRYFFEQEHPGRTFNCYLGYGNALVDLTATDNSIKNNVVLNFLQISIYDYISNRNEGKDTQEKKIKDNYIDSDKLISSNTILNWFNISPKSSERSSNIMEKENSNIESKTTFSDLVDYFKLNPQIIRWNIDNMVSRGLIEITSFDDQEFFNIPKTFNLERESVNSGSNLKNSEPERDLCLNDSTNNLSISDMTIMLDFNNIIKNNTNTKLIKNNIKTQSLEQDKSPKDTLELNCSDNDNEEYQNIHDQTLDDNEDLNLNFPTGIITTSIPFKSKENVENFLNGTNSQKLMNSKREINDNKSNLNNGNLPPLINVADTYLNKYCYFTTPKILDDNINTRVEESSALKRDEKMTFDKNETTKYEVIRECELLIRATLQLNGAMAPAVLFGRVRTAIANQIEGRSQMDSANQLDTGSCSNNNNQHVLTWAQHVQAINNMVDRGEIYNKGGRLFLEK